MIKNSHWLLIATIVFTIANALVPFAPADVQAGITSILLIISGYLGIQEKQSAVLSAKAQAINSVRTPQA